MRNHCMHMYAVWVPDRPTPDCEDGSWVCMDCGAEKQRAYRPFLEVWRGGKEAL